MNDRVVRNNKWWYKRIRANNWFSFRYWWFNWLIFLGGIFLFWWLCPCTQPESSVSCDNSNFNQHLNDISSILDSCCACHEIAENQIFEADYLIITYQFDMNGGKDLDTKTQLISPRNSLPVGYCDKGDRNTHQNEIIWSGDNREYGVESCLIDLTKFSTNAVVKVVCKAKWWQIKSSGNMSIDIKAYLGGQMDLRDYQFFNIGGELTTELSFSERVTDLGSTCPINETIGTVSYDKGTMRLEFN